MSASKRSPFSLVTARPAVLSRRPEICQKHLKLRLFFFTMVESSARPRGTGGHGLQAFQAAPANAQGSRARPDGNHGNGASDGSRTKRGKEVGTSGSGENGENENDDDGSDKEEVDNGLTGASGGSASGSDQPEQHAPSANDLSLRDLLASVGDDARQEVQRWIEWKMANAPAADSGTAALQKTGVKKAPLPPSTSQPLGGPTVSSSNLVANAALAPSTATPVITTTGSTPSAAAPKISMSRTGEFFSNSVEAPEALITLLLSKHYLSLTLCTTAAMKDIATNPAAVKYTKIHDRWSVKRDLIDASFWPSEAWMSKEDWLDAYRNFDTILGEAAEADVRNLFKEHFDFLCKRPEFRDSFAVISTLR